MDQSGVAVSVRGLHRFDRFLLLDHQQKMVVVDRMTFFLQGFESGDVPAAHVINNSVQPVQHSD